MISVEELMSTEVHTLTAVDTVYDARRMMIEQHIRHIPIVDDAMHIVGLVSHRDVLAASESTLVESSKTEQAVNLHDIAIEKIMTKNVSVIDYRDNLLAAAHHLQKYRHGSMPVVKEGKIAGIITSSDFVNIAIQNIEMMDVEAGIDEEMSEDLGSYDDLV